MSEVFSELFSTRLTVALVSAAAGGVVTLFVTALRARTARFRYSTRVERVGTSVNDPIFGEVRVQWLHNDVRNLYMALIEIENASSRDFEDVALTIYTGNDTLLLSEHTAMIDSPNVVQWSPAFKARLEVPAGGVLTQAQWDIYNHRREYMVPVFNRGQVLEFRYACTRPNDDVIPHVFVDAPVKGVKLLYRQMANVVFGVPFELALVRGTVSAVLVSALAARLFGSVWIATAVGFLAGYTALAQGALVSKAMRRLWAAIFG